MSTSAILSGTESAIFSFENTLQVKYWLKSKLHYSMEFVLRILFVLYPKLRYCYRRQ